MTLFSHRPSPELVIPVHLEWLRQNPQRVWALFTQDLVVDRVLQLEASFTSSLLGVLVLLLILVFDCVIGSVRGCVLAAAALSFTQRPEEGTEHDAEEDYGAHDDDRAVPFQGVDQTEKGKTADKYLKQNSDSAFCCFFFTSFTLRPKFCFSKNPKIDKVYVADIRRRTDSEALNLWNVFFYIPSSVYEQIQANTILPTHR